MEVDSVDLKLLQDSMSLAGFRETGFKTRFIPKVMPLGYKHS